MNAPFVFLQRTVGIFLWSILIAKTFHSSGSPECFLANFRQAFIFLPGEQCFLPWCPAMNLIFLQLLFDGGLINADWSQGQRRLQTAWCWNMGSFWFPAWFFILCSWRDFGKMTTSWKIHYCPTVSLLLQHVVGWDSVEPWSFWNDFGSISRLTGVNIVPLEI